MVAINLDGFSLANRLRFAKFAKLSPRQTFPLYGILILFPYHHLLFLLYSLNFYFVSDNEVHSLFSS